MNAWDLLAAEPADDAEIEMHIRQAETCRCLPCLDKLRLIARIKAVEGELAEMMGAARQALAKLRELRSE